MNRFLASGLLSLLLLSAIALLNPPVTQYTSAQQQVREGMKPYTPTRLEWLTLYLNVHYKYDGPHFAVYFIANQTTDSITIMCDHFPGADGSQVKQRIMFSRKVTNDLAKTKGWDSWIKVGVGYKALPKP